MIESTDPYVYPRTQVLRNLRGIYDGDVLAAFEADVTFSRLTELGFASIRGTFGTLHLKSVHAYIFQDVYPWAGQFRTLNISKGANSFARADFIEPSLDDLFRKLAKENFLVGLSREAFIERVAFFFGEINAVHPFREGNGRTQREFIRQLAANAGFTIDWRSTTRDQMIAASQASFLRGDNSGLKILVQACLAEA